jgi:hypothetical protein
MIGHYDDVQSLANEVGVNILEQAEAEQFNARSWTYWLYGLGLCEPSQVPQLAPRRTGSE